MFKITIYFDAEIKGPGDFFAVEFQCLGFQEDYGMIFFDNYIKCNVEIFLVLKKWMNNW